jgi:hypothetical protein
MSSKNRADAVRDSARQAAAQLKPAVQRARPLAKNTSQAARRRLLRTRAWAAPQVERSGKVLENTVAPKVSAMLSSAARRLDPGRSRQRRWRKPAGMATVTAAGGAVAAYLRGRRKPAGEAAPPSAPADTVRATPPNGQQQSSVGTGAAAPDDPR